MKRRNRGMTLVELLIATTIMALISAAAAALLSVSLQAHAYGADKSDLYREGSFAMERMTRGVRNTTYLQIPNAQSITRDILAVSRLVNLDNDFYFGDPLFPRIDEDIEDKFAPSGFGILGIDDDGDGTVDEALNASFQFDDDEDGLKEEDILDGIDNDGDGSIDEEAIADANLDAQPGIAGMDDDGDGLIDEASNASFKIDDDEDGLKDEDGLRFVMYTFDAGSRTLSVVFPDPNLGVTSNPPTFALSTHATAFTATYEVPNATRAPRVLITLTLTDDHGESVTFSEYAYPRNILQKTGKRVR